MVWLDHLRIEMDYLDEMKCMQAADISWSNGFTTKDGIVFLDRDPYFVLQLQNCPRRVRIHAEIHFIKTREAEMLLAEAENVSNYDLIFQQMEKARRMEWMEQ